MIEKSTIENIFVSNTFTYIYYIYVDEGDDPQLNKVRQETEWINIPKIYFNNVNMVKSLFPLLLGSN